jgi:hypothetical protein
VIPGRQWLKVPILLGAAIIAFGAAVYLHFGPQKLPPPVPPSLAATAASDELEAGTHVRPPSSVPVRKTQRELPEAAAASPVAAQDPAAQLLARLTSLDTNKPLRPEQAAAVKQDLAQLAAQGTNAIPAIRQFLQKNQDLSLDDIKGGNAVGYGSLRAGLFDVLRQIGGTEGVAALTDVLRSTADPDEIGQLARRLEELAPGEHRDEILSAARDTLAQVAESKSKVDVASLFQILQTYGDANVVPDLQKSVTQWGYYGLMALAGLPDGQGIPALVQQARQLGPDGTAKDAFAVQMLAQVAAQSPEAASALLEEVKAGHIPDGAWRSISDALAGDQYQFIKDPNASSASLMQTPGLNTYHIEAGNENYYSVSLTASGSAADLGQRSALIDQLLAATSNPAAIAALEQAKRQLGR